MCREVAKEDVFRLLQIHLAVASRGHGVFKGVKKRRKIPREKKKAKKSDVIPDREALGLQFEMRGGLVGACAAMRSRKGWTLQEFLTL
jgi:hypothetical protein